MSFKQPKMALFLSIISMYLTKYKIIEAAIVYEFKSINILLFEHLYNKNNYKISSKIKIDGPCWYIVGICLGDYYKNMPIIVSST